MRLVIWTNKAYVQKWVSIRTLHAASPLTGSLIRSDDPFRLLILQDALVFRPTSLQSALLAQWHRNEHDR